MLHLVDKSKVGRNLKDENGESTDWRRLFRSSEDSFTSSIFSLLSYLPAHDFWQVLKEGIHGNFKFDYIPEKLETISFWPRWKKGEGSYCEPDVFIEFDKFNVIVEAKRWDNNQQSEEQWKREVESYNLEYSDSDKPLILFAVGGTERNLSASSINYRDIEILVLKLRWRQLLNVVNSRLRKVLSNKTEVFHFYHIYKDLILAFRIHGFQTGFLFDTMPSKLTINLNQGYVLSKTISSRIRHIPNIQINNYNNSVQVLCQEL